MNLLDGRPKVQVSLDLTNLDEALATARIAVRAGVDWLEAGTPLILAEGLHAVKALRKEFPDHPVVADLKTMDAGFLEAEMMFKAGAAFVVVMAVAHERTVREAVRAGKQYSGLVMADVMLHADKPGIAKKLESWGVDAIIVHTGYDERHHTPGLSPLDDLVAVRAAVKIPLQAVGGLSIEQAAGMPGRGAPLVVIGAPLAIADAELKPGADEAKLEAVIREFVTRVKAGG
ncbi:MAG: orotidine 5'-phosphate decarboxylase / HUMPS family protein [Candidatus Coatesbacteria bacterium]